MSRRGAWLAVGTFATVLAGAALLGASAIRADSHEAEHAGQQVFLKQSCNLCHAVEGASIEAKTASEKMRGPDLTQVTARHPDEWIKRYLHKEEQQNGKAHMKTFGGSDEELAQLLAWLHELADAASEAEAG